MGGEVDQLAVQIWSTIFNCCIFYRACQWSQCERIIAAAATVSWSCRQWRHADPSVTVQWSVAHSSVQAQQRRGRIDHSTNRCTVRQQYLLQAASSHPLLVLMLLPGNLHLAMQRSIFLAREYVYWRTETARHRHAFALWPIFYYFACKHLITLRRIHKYWDKVCN